MVTVKRCCCCNTCTQAHAQSPYSSSGHCCVLMIPLVLSPKQPRGFSSCGGGVRGGEIPGYVRQPLWCSNPGAVTRHPQDLVRSVDDLLKNSGDLESLGQSSKHVTATHLLSGLEKTLRTLAKAIPKGSFTYRSDDDTGETMSCSTPAPQDPLPHPEPPITVPSLLRAVRGGPGAGERKRHRGPEPCTDTAGLGCGSCSRGVR